MVLALDPIDDVELDDSTAYVMRTYYYDYLCGKVFRIVLADARHCDVHQSNGKACFANENHRSVSLHLHVF